MRFTFPLMYKMGAITLIKYIKDYMFISNVNQELKTGSIIKKITRKLLVKNAVKFA